jgi:hypothetical protein
LEEYPFSQDLQWELADDPPDGEATLDVSVRMGDLVEHYPWALTVAHIRPAAVDFRDLVGRKLHSRPLFTWGLAFRGQAEQPGDQSTGASFHPDEALPCGGVSKPGFFSHPPYVGGVGYSFAVFGPVTLPEEPCEFHTFIGLRDGGDPSGGVDFSVLLWSASVSADAPAEAEASALQGGVELFKVHWKERAWQEVSADLTPWAGQTVRFKFIADVGPADSSTADLASWGEPVVRLREERVRLRFRPGERG